MHVVIDADGLMYRSGFAAETCRYMVSDIGFDFDFPSKAKAKKFCHENGIDEDRIERQVTAEPIENVLHTLKLQIGAIEGAIAEEYGSCERPIIVISGDENFRYDVATIRPYKGNRDPDHKPVHLQAMKDYLRSQWGALVSQGVEADDVLAQLGTSNRGKIVLCTMDKDLWQVPGLHYDYLRKQHFEISDRTGLCNLYEQILVGDSADNITGCYKIGEGMAGEIISCSSDLQPDDGLLEHTLYTTVKWQFEYSLERYGDKCPYAGMSARAALHEIAKLCYLLRSRSDKWRPPY